MNILGLNLSYASSACLVTGGKIARAVQQERFSRVKNDERFPKEAIDFCARGMDIDRVYIASEQQDIAHRLTRFYSTFDVRDRLLEQENYWRPKLLRDERPEWLDVFSHKLDLDQYPGNWGCFLEEYLACSSLNERSEMTNAYLAQVIRSTLGGADLEIQYLDHHSCHSYFSLAVYREWLISNNVNEQDVGIITIDAYGDGLSATISGVGGDYERVERKKSIAHSEFQLARIYRYTTLILGMLPDQHEYKVMGLAPYNRSKYAYEVRAIFEQYMELSEIDFKFISGERDIFYSLKDKLNGYRFDQIAAGLQMFAEDIICDWVESIVKQFRFKTLLFSGGVAANIKALQKVMQLDDVENVLVPPAPGDESLSIGAAVMGSCINQDQSPSFDTVYLGPGAGVITNSVLEDCHDGCRIIREYTQSEIAKLLAQGRVLGRCCGQSEFGPRALGNRSILADPRDPSIIAVINKSIKNRDFWMPFAPIILDVAAEEYLINPNGNPASFMTLAFDTAPDAPMLAGMHPFDRSARPQILAREDNPDLYDLIYEFGQITGCYSVLNTSFNLHGYPIVLDANDAYDVLMSSALDGIVLDDMIILKEFE